MVCNDILYVISNKFRLIMIYIVCMHVYTVRRPRDTDTLGWIGITPVFTLGNSGVCVYLQRIWTFNELFIFF